MPMKFRTELEHPKSDIRFGYEERILTLGSCFSDEIGSRMHRERFRVVKNPFGTIYNPLVIELISEVVASKKLDKLEEANLQNGGKWFNYYFHSSVNGNSKEELQKKISEKLETTRHELEAGSVIILTLGTSKIFWRKEREKWVGNCHKKPSKDFSESFLSTKELVDSLENTISNFRSIQHGLNFILTVSPIRHMRMGMIENQRSKARLILACEEVNKKIKNASYFPSYEILMDDLRDYRFYGKDLIHPSEEAVDYIWEKFKTSHLEDVDIILNEKIRQIIQGLQHRPFDPDSKEHRSFLTALLNKAEQLNHSDLLSEDIKEIKNRLG